MVVVSSDKDLCQLVGPRCTVFDFARERRFDAAGVQARLGVRPEQVTDFLGLAGDAVDCIPGVRGLGAKTACVLLRKFKNLEDIYADCSKLAKLPIRGAEGIIEKLQNQKKEAFLSRKLATLVRKRIAGTSIARLRRRRPVNGWESKLEDLGVSRLSNRVRDFPL